MTTGSISRSLDAVREVEFPWTASSIYLNNASIGPIPERTRRALEEFNQKRTAPHLLPDRYLFGVLAETRRLAARLVGADPTEIALATNTGWGLNLAARSLPLEPGDIVLVSDREFPANVYPWMRLRGRGIAVELVPTTREGWPDERYLIERLEDRRVRVLAVSLVQFSSGYAVDLARLSEVARATNTFLVVDAIQGLGQLPVNLGETPVDVLACGGQKWLLSPWGSGFVYVRRELIPRLDPAVTGWMAFEGTDDFSRLTRYDDTLRDDARRFEFITLPFQDFAGMNASLDLLLEIGIERVRDHIRCTHEPVRVWADRRGVPIASPQGERGSAILCVEPPDAPRVFRSLKAAGITCSLREGAIRLSPHFYNTSAELARVAEVLDAALDG